MSLNLNAERRPQGSPGGLTGCACACAHVCGDTIPAETHMHGRRPIRRHTGLCVCVCVCVPLQCYSSRISDYTHPPRCVCVMTHCSVWALTMWSISLSMLRHYRELSGSSITLDHDISEHHVTVMWRRIRVSTITCCAVSCWNKEKELLSWWAQIWL